MPSRQDNGFRPDIEGLRAVAIGAVLLDHAGVPFLAGGFAGVDVFFVISGFLITGMLVREAHGPGGISLAGFYAGRAKRLLPLAVTVLAVVAGLSALLLSPVRADGVGDDIVAAGAYVINWHLAAQSVDYFAGGADVSPVQHFWSLAVEEQFYLVWPLLIIVATWWPRRRGRSLGPWLWVAFVAVAVASLVYGVGLTRRDAGLAYFSSPARAWELALGGIAALAVARRSPSGRLAVAAGWAGLGAIAAAALAFDETTAFPGLAALLPVLGAVAIVAVGAAGGRASVGRLLGRRPVRHVGRVSYAWYLWHWPLLVLAQAAWGALSVAEGLAVVAASWLPAVASHRLIERPLHRSRLLSARPRRALRLGLACTVLAVVLGVGLSAVQPHLRTAPASDVLGASVERSSTTVQASASAVRPSPCDADRDRSQLYRDGCLVEPKDTTSGRCVYGDRSSKTTVVLFGDSHAMQYFPALQTVAKARGWRLVGLTKAGCTPADVEVVNDQLRRAYRECQTWRERTLRRIATREHPQMVLTSGLSDYTVVSGSKRLSADDSRAALSHGWRATLTRLRATSAKVVVVRDGPVSPRDVPDCVSGALDDLARCAFTAAQGVDAHPVEVAAARAVGGVRVVDPTPVLCPDGTCPAVIGNALVYRDRRHLTATFVATLAPWLADQLPSLRTSA